MLAQALISTLALAASANAHAFVLSAWVDGEDTWDGTTVGEPASYLRAPGTNSPVQDITAAALACNVKGTTEVSGSLTVQAGDIIEPEWYHAGERGADPIDPSHKGPLTTWLAPYESNTAGDVWVKIAEEGWSSTTSDWAVDRMIANGGRNTATIPASLAPGKYLIRFDLLALHSASAAPPNGAQFYPSCAQLTVEGSGTQALPAGVALPGAFTDDTPGIVWNIYYSTEYDIHTDYVIPGPAVWDGSAAYPTAQCTTPLDGLASPGFCYDGSTAGNTTTTTSPSTAPTTVSGAASGAASSAAAASGAASSAAASSSVVSSGAASSAPAVALSSGTVASSIAAASTVVGKASSSAVGAASGAASSAPAAVSSAVSSSAGSGTTTAAASTVTDYSGCMREYNACLDAANAAQAAAGGGAADFSTCANDCATAYGRRRLERRLARGGARAAH